jgi:hypothetical protein
MREHAGGQRMKEAVKNELVERYFRYLSLITVVRDSYGLADLSPQQEALLEFIAQCWHDEKPLSVRQLMSTSALASTVTIHRWLKGNYCARFCRARFGSNGFPKTPPQTNEACNRLLQR